MDTNNNEMNCLVPKREKGATSKKASKKEYKEKAPQQSPISGVGDS